MQVISVPLYVHHLPEILSKVKTKYLRRVAFLISQADDFFHVCLWLGFQKNADNPHPITVLSS